MKLTPIKLLITAIIMVISVAKVAVDANIADPFAEEPESYATQPEYYSEKLEHLSEKSEHYSANNNIIIKKDNNNNNVVVDVDDNCEVDLVLAFAVNATGAKDSKPFIRRTYALGRNVSAVRSVTASPWQRVEILLYFKPSQVRTS